MPCTKSSRYLSTPILCTVYNTLLIDHFCLKKSVDKKYGLLYIRTQCMKIAS